MELIDRLMWQEYEKETQPHRRVKILETKTSNNKHSRAYRLIRTLTNSLTFTTNPSGHGIEGHILN